MCVDSNGAHHIRCFKARAGAYVHASAVLSLESNHTLLQVAESLQNWIYCSPLAFSNDICSVDTEAHTSTLAVVTRDSTPHHDPNTVKGVSEIITD